MAPRFMSIADLKAELRNREKALAGLMSRRAKALRRLAKIDRQIAAVGGKAGGVAVSVVGKAAPAARAARRWKGDKPLVQYIREALEATPKGLRVKEVMEAVKKAGYKSASHDFYGIVSATVRQFKRVRRGVYKV